MASLLCLKNGDSFYFYDITKSKHVTEEKDRKFLTDEKKSPSCEIQLNDPAYILDCSFDEDGVSITFKRKIFKHSAHCNRKKKCGCRVIKFRYVREETDGDLSAYEIPDEIFESTTTLSKKHNLLVMFNEYVKVFGNLQGKRVENYFDASLIDKCEYYLCGEFLIDGFSDRTSVVKIVDHNKMKIFIELIKTVIDYFEKKKETTNV